MKTVSQFFSQLDRISRQLSDAGKSFSAISASQKLDDRAKVLAVLTILNETSHAIESVRLDALNILENADFPHP